MAPESLFMVKSIIYCKMPKVTFEVPPELKRLMDAYPEINWSAVFRQSVDRQVRALEIAREILDEASDPRVQAVALALKKGVSRRFRGGRRARHR